MGGGDHIPPADPHGRFLLSCIKKIWMGILTQKQVARSGFARVLFYRRESRGTGGSPISIRTPPALRRGYIFDLINDIIILDTSKNFYNYTYITFLVYPSFLKTVWKWISFFSPFLLLGICIHDNFFAFFVTWNVFSWSYQLVSDHHYIHIHPTFIHILIHTIYPRLLRSLYFPLSLKWR